MTRSEEINSIIDTASEALKKLGVKYFIGVLDRQPKSADGGKAYAQSDIKGSDMGYILDMALPTRQDVAALGVWLGQLIIARERALKKQNNGR